MLNKKQQENKEHPSWILRTALIIALVVLLGVTGLFILSLSPSSIMSLDSNLIIIAFIALSLAIIAYCTLSNSQLLNKLLILVKQRECLIKLAVSLCFGALITVAINVAAVSISKAQFALSNHSTFPNFKLNCESMDNSVELILFSEVGSASHISATIKDHCYFLYKNTPCELDIDQPTKICSGSGFIDSQERSTSFKPEYDYTDSSSAQKIVKDVITERFPGAKYISVSRFIDITFFDYQNQQATYRFFVQDDQIELISTTTPLIAKNNICATAFGDIAPYEEIVENTAISLFEKFTIVSDQDAYF